MNELTASGNRRGFTLIELIVVIAIIGILAAILIPQFAGFVNKSNNTVCHANRETLIRQYYYLQAAGAPPIATGTSLKNYFEANSGEDFAYDENICPQDGEISWEFSDGSLAVKCSLHAPETTVLLTPYGNTFQEISSGLIGALQAYKAKTGNYLATWGDSRYKALGLDPADWDESNPINHISYSLKGSMVNIRPEPGYTISLKSAINGKDKVMPESNKWNITYDDITGKWYYHNVAPGEEVDITTIVVYPSSPKK